MTEAVEEVSVRLDTGDLSVGLLGRTVLELLNMSAGYEAWQINTPGRGVIATGGGELALRAVPTPPPKP